MRILDEICAGGHGSGVRDLDCIFSFEELDSGGMHIQAGAGLGRCDEVFICWYVGNSC